MRILGLFNTGFLSTTDGCLSTLIQLTMSFCFLADDFFSTAQQVSTNT